MTYPFVVPATGQTTNQLLKKNLDLLNSSTAGVVTLDTTQTITGTKTMSALVLGANMDGGGFKISGLAKGTATGNAAIYDQVPRTLFNHNSDTATTHTDGTEDDLYSDTLTAGVLGANGDKIFATEYLVFAASATAARRVKKYFGGTQIFDSGSLTLTLGGDFSIATEVIRESSSIVRIVVRVTTTSASSVPYVTYTRITGLTLANTQVLKSTGIASGTGAASGDITEKMGWIQWIPA